MATEYYIKVTFALYLIGWVYSFYHKEWVETVIGSIMLVWALAVLTKL